MEMAQNEQSDRLPRIETKIDTIIERLDQINGKVREAEKDIINIQKKCVAHDLMAVTDSKADISSDAWRGRVNADIRSLRESRAGMKSNLSLIGILLTLMLMLWQSISAHQQAQAPPHTPPQQAAPR